MSTSDKARDAAIEMLTSGDNSFTAEWPIANSEDNVVVIIRRIPKNKVIRLDEQIKTAQSVASVSSANKCSACNGTGRIY